MIRRFIAACGVAALLACMDNTGPSGVPNDQLHIVLQDTLAPPLDSTVGRFWAKVGENRELRLEYLPPADSAEDFLRFEVPSDGLFRRPDGSAFQPGDSILITVTVVDAARFHFQFEPAGLQFNPQRPARLRIDYFNANHDFDGDGDIDTADDEIERILDLWRREGPSAPWFRVGSIKFEALDEIDANIFGFTEYALAW